VRPSDYPPPWRVEEAIATPSDSEPVEVDVAIVGAGPAGLAAAIRLGQVAPELSVAVLEKGQRPGAHLLSGAVVRPAPLRELVGDDFPSYGEVPGEAVYFLTRSRGWRIPTPPTMRNHGNVVVSLAQLGRWLGEKAEAGGAMILPETDAQQLLVEDGRVVGVRTGDKGRGRRGEELGRFEPGSEIRARSTILCEGTGGHLTGAALSYFGLAAASPQVWALGVKEVWRVEQPLRRVIHTMGWPLRGGARYREFGGSFVYPMGDDHVSLGMVVGLDYRDAELSVHDLLQELKTHPLVRGVLDGGERVGWGAKTIPEGGFVTLPRAFHAPGLLLCGDGVGLVNVPALKGIHYAVESGRLAAEAAANGELAAYDGALRDSWVWPELRAVRNMRQAFGGGFWRGTLSAGLATVTGGRVPFGDRPTERDADQELFRTDRAASYPAPDGKLTFDKLSSVFLSGNRTRDDQPNHIRVHTEVPRTLAEMWVRMCPAQVYELKAGEAEDGARERGAAGEGEGEAEDGARERGAAGEGEGEAEDGARERGAAGEGELVTAAGEGELVTVRVTPSNCVQCGAITAKGGRLTPPEGGSGPEYTLT
jgi:electron-transferring-flavoprotein dehydrogenase